ncbi:MAG: transposase [Dehalococcoidia bacterium]|nr:transposase [Dehalococcoidia bacterium]
MDARQERGLEIAARSKIIRKGDVWLVPSQTQNGDKYTVIPGLKCSCPDHETRLVKCKHMFAVEYVMERETAPDGTVTETESVKVTKVTRKTYSQNWPAYNAAQSEEKTRFGVLLADLCKGIPQPIHEGRGRPALPLADMLFASAYKVYTGFSSRRFTSDLRDAKTEGLVASTPHFNSVTNYLADPDMTPILKHLVTVSSLPLKAVETEFAIDSSGFTTSRFIRWFNKKYGREIDNREWVKVHLMCGVSTHIVTSVDISGWEANDTTYFVPLVEQTARNFQIAEISADKAYLSHKNLATVEAVNATPFIPFKSNTVPTKETSAWGRMYHYFMLNRDEFLTHYHRRSNVESVFSMCKAKFGDAVRSKSSTGMVNEVLAKVLCHNICVLIQAVHELGIEPNFCAQLGLAQKIA